MTSGTQAKSTKIANVVFGVVGVLFLLMVSAALFVPKVIGRSHMDRRASAQTDMAEIASMLDHFHLDCDRYPTDKEGLYALTNPPANIAGKWHGPYSSKLVPNDPWGNPYAYATMAKGYALTSYGADGQAGGKGEDADIVETK